MTVLLARPELEEIEKVIMSCDGNRCPRPDEFNFAFVSLSGACLSMTCVVCLRSFIAMLSFRRVFLRTF